MQANLEWFRTFRAIYETGTMSGAAKQLYVSQPGIGLHLNALEVYTGFPLFERTPRKMIPTERGKLLYQQMLNSLLCLEDIETRFQRKSGTDRATVSVGMCVETFQQVLERHIPNLNFNLIMQFGSNDQLEQSLESGSADLILTTSKSAGNGCIYTPYTVERLVLVAGRNTDISGFQIQDKVKLNDWMKAQLWYSTAADMGVLNLFWENSFGERPGFVPNYIVPNKFSIIRCLSEGNGLAVLPDFLCKEAMDSNRIRKIWEGYKPIENTLYFGKRKQSLFMDEIEQIEKMLIDEFQ
ncbi:LysR family transcriptional regulator [Chitinophaga sancti]|uniref:DNA-binding transcriptional regulator, LysR family n=1 Tax=Chitinophaga sancti TaxID=1004 RepID=A0A1K1R523_9BACT|nr:LysR family transcriptional regulator [Chitinophaga sancti]WQD64225.1 LysR family transcriptional regulator [Chitinophaga sancti]WQG90151.1 LysR family transcriptional regulator [Chitinophaga sancti]SFW67330.1 DNA-binding transcriptional regulator, LysR family [Chitinophaga sancti]